MLDRKDFAIIEALKENSKLSTQKIARMTRIPLTTVHNRIRKMEADGVIKGYSILLDSKKIGKPIGAYILITVDYKLLNEVKKTQHELAQQLLNHSAVESSAMITGASDIMIKVRCGSIDELNEFVTVYLRNTRGIEKTQTSVVLNEA